MTAYPRKRPKKRKACLWVAGLAIDPGETPWRGDLTCSGGFWELPWGEIAADSTRPAELRKHLRSEAG